MNKLIAYISNNTHHAFKTSILKIKDFIDDFSHENIIIVPDKLSLYTEQKIFELLDISVYFNLTVMGISKFANKIISENNLEYMQCSNLESQLMTLKAIQNVSNNFKCFSDKYTLGFVDEIYAKIEQIKSSNADINELIDENSDEGTKLKFEDIKLIYNEYEKLRANKIDSGSLLNLFNNICSESEYLKKCNVFFIGFDSMTKQGLEVLKNTIKNSNYTQISITAPYQQNNSNIYDRTFLDSVISICKEEKFESEMIWLNPEKYNDNKNSILNNIFSRKNKINKTNNYFSIFKANSFFEEITKCVKHINFLLKTENIKFRDIAICAPQDIHTILESELNKLNIDTYADKEISLFQLEPIDYIFKILKYCHDGKDKSILIDLIVNSFCDLSENIKYNFINLINQYSSTKSITNSCNDLHSEILKYIQIIEEYSNIKISGYKDFFSLLENIIKKENIFEKINNLCKNFKYNNEIYLEKIYLQIEEKLQKLIDTLKSFLSKEPSTAEQCLEVLEKALKECVISAIPSGTNQIFIGDTKSFYYDKKYIFMLGLNEGITPITLTDTGLITDKEISSETIRAKLEPTTKIINKRNKFKVFEILLSAEQKCFLSYHIYDSSNKHLQPSDFIIELKYLFNNIETTSEYFYIYDENNLSNKKICFNAIDSYNANLNIRNNSSNRVSKILKNSLILNNELYINPIKNSARIDFKKLFFNNDSTSISVVEKYNNCPKSAFLSNALNLRQQKKDRVEANTIGSFIHEVGEIFVKYNKTKLGTFTTEEIKKIIPTICNSILDKEEYTSIKLDKNRFILKMLIDECIRFCDFINYEQKNSAFKAVYEEKHFGGMSLFKPITINVSGHEYKISGFIDRVDEYNNHFRIIDYKTGNTTNSKGKDYLFYGTKIQLFVYAEAIRQNISKKLFGAFYLPIKNSFSKNGENNYHLSGFFKNDANLVMLCDYKINQDNLKSKILNCSLNKKIEGKEQAVRKKPNILSEEELDAYIKYSIEMVKKTIQNIEKGFIDCSPLTNFCELCEFNKICKKAKDEKIIRNEDFEIKSDKFLELNYD